MSLLLMLKNNPNNHQEHSDYTYYTRGILSLIYLYESLEFIALFKWNA